MSPRTGGAVPTPDPGDRDGAAARESRFVRSAAAGRDRLGAALEPTWRDRRVGIMLAIAAAALWGLLAARWTPRRPLTSAQALWSIAFSLVVGAAAGLLMRSRWAMLTAPLAFAVLFELARIGTDGPTVDGIHMSTYGILALVVGRGFHALLSLVPLLFGAMVGAGIARWLTRPADSAPPRRSVSLYLRRGLAGLPQSASS